MMGFLMTSAQNSLSLMVTKESTTLAPIKTVGTNKNKWEKKDCWYFPQRKVGAYGLSVGCGQSVSPKGPMQDLRRRTEPLVAKWTYL